MPPISSWTRAHIEAIAPGYCRSPLIRDDDLVPAADGLDIWDAWPVQLRDGTPAVMDDGSQVWMALAAPHFADPDERHRHARIHLFRREHASWRHLGPAMPEGFSPGSREWSGSAICDPEDGLVTLYFTAAGRRGEPEPTFEQRMYSARATLASNGLCKDWHDLRETVRIDRAHYMPTTGGGQIGTIKAFRDPFYFRDPLSGTHYLYFSASLAGSPSVYNGAVGMAVASPESPDDWRLMPPILSADGLNNELERPHVVMHEGLYYLFWSTQRQVFSPEGPGGPTGLYGMVSDRPDGGWRPLNGSGLVFANPDGAPAQAYSWMVLPDLSVTSFIDDWGAGSVRRFGGSFAPFLDIFLEDDRAMLKGAHHAG